MSSKPSCDVRPADDGQWTGFAAMRIRRAISAASIFALLVFSAATAVYSASSHLPPPSQHGPTPARAAAP